MENRPNSKRSRPRPGPADTNQLAKRIVDLATGSEPVPADDETNEMPQESAAVASGRLGGLKGGKARAETLSAEERSAIAKKAAEARWKDKAG